MLINDYNGMVDHLPVIDFDVQLKLKRGLLSSFLAHCPRMCIDFGHSKMVQKHGMMHSGLAKVVQT